MTLAKASLKFGVTAWQIGRILKKMGLAIKKTFTYVEASKERREEYLKIKKIFQLKALYILMKAE